MVNLWNLFGAVFQNGTTIRAWFSPRTDGKANDS